MEQILVDTDLGRIILDLDKDGHVVSVELTFYTGPEKRFLAPYHYHRPSKKLQRTQKE